MPLSPARQHCLNSPFILKLPSFIGAYKILIHLLFFHRFRSFKDPQASLHGTCVPWVRSRTRAARFRVAAFLHSHEMGHCPVSFPLARSRVAAFLLSHPCGGRMVYLMERECRIHKDKEPQGSSPYAAVAGATIPFALGKAA